MSVAAVRRVVSRLDPDRHPSDAALVAALDPTGADRERAFTELVARYGPMVLGACRRVLADAHDAEDAFQAVFLVLARKADAVRPPGAVGGWLHGVAVRTAQKAKTAAARRRRREMIATARADPYRPTGADADPTTGAAERAELRAAIDAELAALPEMHRAAVVLCDLHGQTRAAAAAELNCPEGTVAAWLARGRKALAARLARRGVGLPAAGLVAVAAPSPVAAELAASAAALVLGRGASTAVRTLSEGVMRSLSSGTTKLGAVLVAAGALFLAVATAAAWQPDAKTAPTPGGNLREVPHQEPGAKVNPDPNPAPDAPVAPPAAKSAPGAWRENNALELTGWLGGSVAFSADGSALFVGGTDGHVHSYEFATRKLSWEHTGAGQFAAVALAPDGKTVACTTKDGVQFLDAATGKAGDALEAKGSEPAAVAFFRDERIVDEDGHPFTSRRVIFGNARGYFVKAWIEWPKVSTIESSTVAAGKEPADKYAVPLAVAPDGKRVVVTGPIDRATGRNVLWAWAAGSGAANKVLDGHKAAVVSAVWSRDGKFIVTGDADGTAIIWDAETFKEKARRVLGGRIVGLAVSPDGTHTAAAVTRVPQAKGPQTHTEEVFVWSTAHPPEKPGPLSSRQVAGPFRGVASLAFAPDGKSLAATFANFDHLAKPGRLVGQVRVFGLEGKPAEDPEEKALATVKRLGGQALRDESRPGKPVYQVTVLGNEVTDADLKDLAGFTELSWLTIGSSEVTDDGLKELARFERLGALSLAGTKVTDAGLKHIVRIKPLVYLNLGGTKIGDAGLKEFGQLKELRTLLIDGTAVTDAGLENLARLDQLTALVLDGTAVTDAGLKHADRLERLILFKLCRTRVTDAGLKNITHLQGLERLSLDQTAVSDGCFAELAKLKGLRELDLADTGLTGVGASALARLPGLKTLHFSNTKVGDAGCKELARLDGLAGLFLDGTKVTDAGCKELARLEGLTTLVLDGTKVTDVGLKELMALTELTTLSLTGTAVTDEGLKDVTKFKKLGFLHLSDTAVTAATVAALQKALPDCQIVCSLKP